jgi:hypothetical protein
MNRIYLFLPLIFILFFCNHNQTDEVSNAPSPHYSIHLKINPAERKVEVKGQIRFSTVPDSLNKLFFYLDRNMQIEHFEFNSNESFRFDTSASDNRYMPMAGKVFVTEDVAHGQTEFNRINFTYRGRLSELPSYFANTIDTEWTEIGKYYPWFPLSTSIPLFSYHITVEAESSYKAFGIGKIEKRQKEWIIKNSTPTNDIVVCLSRNVMHHETQIGNNRLSIFHQNFSNILLEKMSADVVDMFRTYNQWFGKIKSDIFIIESKRERGGGYARIGGLFLVGIDEKTYLSKNEGYHRYFGHELAHLWWYGAPADTWEDWLNESFAEYSALMIVRKEFGESSFLSRLEKKKETSKNTPAVWGLNRADSQNAYPALYDKGPLLLNALEQKLGKTSFISLLRTLSESGVSRTNEFLEVLERTEGKNTATWFEHVLRSE